MTATVRTVIAILFPRECRCAFGKEGADPFPVVVAATGQTLIIALQVKLGVEGVGFGGIDCLLDQAHNKNRFELRRVENLAEFSKDIHRVSIFKDAAIKEIIKEWCWLWDEGDFEGLRQEYRDEWQRMKGQQAHLAGAMPENIIIIGNKYGPR